MTSSVVWLLLPIMSTFLFNGQLILGDLCGFTSTITDHHYNFTVLEVQGKQWSLTVNFSWTEPSGSSDFDAYYIKLVEDGTRTDYGCSAKDGYIQTTQTWHLFNNLDFGFPYEVHIRLYNSNTSKTSFIPLKIDIVAPDCYEQTESIEFCKLQPIPTATKVREPRVESIELNDFENGTDVVLSWLPPVQINGFMESNSVAYRKESAIANEGVISFRPADINWNEDRRERFNTTLYSLLNGTIYIVTIKAYVTNNGQSYWGQSLEFKVNTTFPTDSGFERHTEPNKTPHSNTPGSTTNPKTTASMGSKDSSFSSLPENWQWTILGIIAAIVLCGAIFVLVVVYVKRKSQQMTMVSS